EALIYLSEVQPPTLLSWQELTARVRQVAHALRKLGIVKGDRVVGCLPNAPEAVVAMLATTSIGAVWSGCGPDFGARGVLDRFSQLTPKLMFCVDGYRYGGKPFERRAEMQGIVEGLPPLEHVVLVPYLNPGDRRPLRPGSLLWDEFAAMGVGSEPLRFEQVAPDHPLWILFSSGTT